jgi:hypothetical protein
MQPNELSRMLTCAKNFNSSLNFVSKACGVPCDAPLVQDLCSFAKKIKVKSPKSFVTFDEQALPEN